ncbi:MAG: hypothetical protein FJZ47_06740 [Candidatus Tectomicrobia bacterium]|uniref:Uncharacterized protein n=1 Tax=Tectimicrobiota bacterium TaxID=2528274 RepID=A0A937W105_UNCTE|nr:hypothetical protein [Candidatus Tectomicrobia bacterium]
MASTARYIIWRDTVSEVARPPVAILLQHFPGVTLLKGEEPDYAVILTDMRTLRQLKRELPELCVEPDYQYHVALPH